MAVIEFQGTIQFRRALADEWVVQNPVLAVGEMGIELDTKLFKIGDGILQWSYLPYGGLYGPKGDVGPKGDKGDTGDVTPAATAAKTAAESAAAQASASATSANTAKSDAQTAASQAQAALTSAEDARDSANTYAQSAHTDSISARESLNAIPAVLKGGSGVPTWTIGAGSPEGVVTARIGSLYSRTDGGLGTTLYVKEAGFGNTGWTAK
ncbi:putative tail fiber protein [Ralstonia phage RSP15]|uniref:virion structural protein n=1 Tax=Ralstonia phage RSP15 TaxID=1785960 RepID=UPI00074D3937|nr:virion structural protein [Ralstonia phage RSP15]BAU40034.1 putative tail fiber protein [Ralstonia phage RSP15]